MYDRFDLKTFADQMTDMPENTLAERFSRLDANGREQYLAQINNAAKSDLLTHRKRSAIWGAARRLGALHSVLTNAGR